MHNNSKYNESLGDEYHKDTCRTWKQIYKALLKECKVNTRRQELTISANWKHHYFAQFPLTDLYMQYNQNHTDIFVEIIDSNVHMEIQRYRIDSCLPKYLINFKNKLRRLMKMHEVTKQFWCPKRQPLVRETQVNTRNPWTHRESNDDFHQWYHDKCMDKSCATNISF